MTTLVAYTDAFGNTRMVTPATAEWWTWSIKLWDAMAARFGNPGLAHLEQQVMRSHKERRCVQCGDPGYAEYNSALIQSVKTYWMCKECDDAQKAKYADASA